MSLQPNGVLIGAVRWLWELRDGNQSHAFTVLSTSNEYADLTPTQYAASLRWLRNRGLLPAHPVRDSKHTIACRVLEAALEEALPAWLLDADVNLGSIYELPEDLDSAREVLGLSPADGLDTALAAGRKVDPDAMAEVGAWGEAALMSLLIRAGDGEAEHVSLVSDALGFDIRWRDASLSVHAEVKTTRRRGRLKVFLSRHEYEVGLRDARWRLVVLFAMPEGPIQGLCTVSKDWIATSVPQDVNASATWSTVALRPPVNALKPGLPWLAIGTWADASDGKLIRDGYVGPESAPAWLQLSALATGAPNPP